MKQFARVVAGLVLFWIGVAAQARTMHLYYTDPQGTVLAKTDAQGNILARYDYRPYGGVVSGNGPDGPGYTGHVQDPETGLIYMQQRYDDPLGRFPSPDPVGPVPGDVYSFNRYAYANNNPIVNTDPTGEHSASEGDDMVDCAVYQCKTFFSGGHSGGGNGDQSSSSSSVNIPLRTPASLREYFVGVSTLDRIKAAMVTMDYFDIDYHGLSIFYDSHMRDNADTLQQGQLIIGSQLFNGKSFGHIGAILSHEVEGHWDLQLKGGL